MIIDSVRIENFRSIRDLTCEFGSVTSLIGPNGAGKSNILRALDWFFNGDQSDLGQDDVHFGAADDSEIRIEVNFTDLTKDDRETLGPRYCPSPDTSTFTVWRTWHDGVGKISGRARAYPPFELVRAEKKAADRRMLYGKLRAEHDLPNWSNSDAAEAAMRSWEINNPEELDEAEVSDSHFFGINGRGTLSSLFDFVFVSADLRANEETTERKNSLLGRIVQRALDREEFDDSVDSITKEFEVKYQELGSKYIEGQLDSIADKLTTEVDTYSPGRTVRLTQRMASVKVPPASIAVQISDRGVQTPVTHQGHGFQRALLLAGLTVLSRQERQGGQSSSMFLAIEEPELFQHPTQARAFASVLRSLASDSQQRTQVAYATHSPHFISPEHFDEVRRISSVYVNAEYAHSHLTQAKLGKIQERLDEFIEECKVARRFEQVCLKYLPDALFAERVILVEGDDDAAILEGLGGLVNELAVKGICVAPVGGKSGMMIPFAILEALEIGRLMVVDNDSGCGDRMRKKGRGEGEIVAAVKAHKRDNRTLCNFVNAPEDDYPVGQVNDQLVFVPDTLETLLDSDLPGWSLTREQIVEEGRGVEGKNAATYALAVRECEDKVGSTLHEIAQACVDGLAA